MTATARFRFRSRIPMRGGALLAAVLVMLFAASAALVTAGQSAHRAEWLAIARDAALLAEAKAALLGYAVRYPEAHPDKEWGYLPCPDRDNDGSAQSPCHARNHGAFGRLPWRTLGMSMARDGHGQCLWYAVAGSIKNEPEAMTLNWDSPGQFKIVDSAGQTLAGAGYSVAAVILAPGAALPGQTRPPATPSRCPGSDSAAADLPAFLDLPYALDFAGGIAIVHGLPGSDVNDLVAWLTIDEIFAVLRRRADFSARLDTALDFAAAALHARLDDTAFLAAHTDSVHGHRAHGRLPDAAEFAMTKEQGTLHNNWHDQMRFVVCLDGSACLTAALADSALSPAVVVTETCRALILFGGERQRGGAAQQRRDASERADAAQYLEGANLTSFTTGAGHYSGYRHYAITDPRQPASEDLIRCLP
ncbi:MAG: hypothetical protein LBP86_02820 [Azoarcus sp.]|jgi:hypothetical protein|nr:hypothetical protein [Azoarcus sp.]